MYVNPFAGGQWTPARTDQGVDYIPVGNQPIRAIGNGTVVYSSQSTGWPGGGFISYTLSDGPLAGQTIYVAEHITNLLPVGSKINAGDQIGTAIPGYPFTEWGWAATSGDSPAPFSLYGGSPDGTPTPGGKAFARFLQSLGAPVLQNPGPGPLSALGGSVTGAPTGTISQQGAANVQNATTTGFSITNPSSWFPTGWRQGLFGGFVVAAGMVVTVSGVILLSRKSLPGPLGKLL